MGLMSSETYYSYEPSEAERARLEAVRQRKEEEERRRQEEKRRQEFITNEKDRAAWALNYEMTARRYRIAGLRDRIAVLVRRGSEFQADELLAQIEGAGNLEKVEHQLDCLERQSVPDVAVATGQARDERGDADMMLVRLRDVLTRQETTTVVEGPTLGRWRRLVDQAWQERETNLVFHVEMLKQIDRHLRESLSHAPGERAGLAEEIEDWITRLRAARSLAEAPESRSDLSAMLARFEGLSVAPSTAETSAEMKEIRGNAHALLAAARDADLAVAVQRRFVSAIVQSLESLGCHVETLVPPSGEGAALSAVTGDGDRVEGRVGGDGRVHLRFVHLTDSPDRADQQRQARRRASAWCERRPELIAKIEAFGMKLRPEWSVDPEEEAVAVGEMTTPTETNAAGRRPGSQQRKASAL
jgi:hypothetical protein